MASPRLFDSAVAEQLLSERWLAVQKQFNESSELSLADRPQVHKAAAGGAGWGKSSLHLQASIGNFVTELKAAAARSVNVSGTVK